MDTDELSEQAYKGIIVQAEKFDHDLTSPFGLLAFECKNEDEYLDKAAQLVSEIRDCSDEELHEIFDGRKVNKTRLSKTLDTFMINIKKIKKIPATDRIYEW